MCNQMKWMFLIKTVTNNHFAGEGIPVVDVTGMFKCKPAFLIMKVESAHFLHLMSNVRKK